jgi:hypothetical protein
LHSTSTTLKITVSSAEGLESSMKRPYRGIAGQVDEANYLLPVDLEYNPQGYIFRVNETEGNNTVQLVSVKKGYGELASRILEDFHHADDDLDERRY